MKFVSYIYKGNEGYGIVSKDNTKVIPMDILLKKNMEKIYLRIFWNSFVPILIV